MKFFINNINGLRSKLDYLQVELDPSIDIIALNETKLDDVITDDDLTIPDFSIFRADRNRHGGGIVLYLSHRIIFKARLFTDSHQEIEDLTVNIIHNGKVGRLCCVYRPPSAPVQWLDDFKLFLLDVCNIDSDLFIFGDFNYDFLCADKCKDLKNLLSSFNLTQEVLHPTRTSPNSSTLLDPFITRSTNLSTTSLINVGLPLASDHCTINVIVNQPERVKSVRRTKWCLDRGDYPGLREAIQATNWTFLDDDDMTFDSLSAAFLDKLTKLFETYIPTKDFFLRPKDKPWMSSDIRRCIRKRNRSHVKAKRTNKTEDWETFRKLRNETQMLVRRRKRDYTQSLFDDITSTTGASPDWWRLLKTLSKRSSSTIPTLRMETTHDIKYADDPTDKANMLNDFFISNTELDDENVTFPRLEPLTDQSLGDIRLTIDDVSKQIDDLKMTSPGPDSVPVRVFKEVKNEISPVLTSFFNLSLHRGVFPDF